MSETSDNQKIIDAAKTVVAQMEEAFSGSGFSIADVCEIATNTYFMFMAHNIPDGEYYEVMDSLFQNWPENVAFGKCLGDIFQHELNSQARRLLADGETIH
jgi:hypothetical protein